MVKLKRKGSPKSTSDHGAKRAKTMSPAKTTPSPTALAGVPSPTQTPSNVSEHQHPIELVASRHEGSRPIGPEGSGTQVATLVQMHHEKSDDFLLRSGSLFMNRLNQFHITTAETTLTIPIPAFEVVEFSNMVVEEADEAWVCEERDPFDTDDINEGRIRKDVPGTPIDERRADFKDFVLVQAAHYNIVRGWWEFCVPLDQAFDVFTQLVEVFAVRKPEVFLEVQYCGEGNAIFGVWTADFSDRPEVEDVLLHVRTAAFMSTFHGKMRYKLEVLCNALGLHYDNDWKIRTHLYVRDFRNNQDRSQMYSHGGARNVV